MNTRAKASPIPALMPLPDTGSRAFWPVAALNDDAKCQAIKAMADVAYKKKASPARFTTQMAMVDAEAMAALECKRSFENCRSDGVLLLAWRGSKAMVQALPAGSEA